MKILIEDGQKAFNRAAALQVKEQLERKPDSLIGLALGNTTLGVHAELVRMYRYEGLDFSRAALMLVDESIGIDRNHPATGYSRINRQLFSKVNVKEQNTFTPDTRPADEAAACAWYEKKIASFGGIDLQMLGIGENGHVGFDDPGTPFESLTHTVRISEAAKRKKLEYFSRLEDVPEGGVTLGLKSIMMARRVLLLACGRHKAAVMKKALFGPITTQVPASVLQLHRNLTVIVDAEAAAEILPLMETETRG